MIIFIGGAPCTGKTTLASRLSTHLNLPTISTDTIRAQMQKIQSKISNPDLFVADYTAEEYLPFHSAYEIFLDQNTESGAVWKEVEEYVKPYIDNTSQSIIIEGVAILPNHNLAELTKQSKYHPLFLIDSDANRIRSRVYGRGLWDDANAYPDHLKPVEVEWLKIANRWYQSEADRYSFPTLQVSDEIDINKAVSLITGT